jgi:hypothetical protein
MVLVIVAAVIVLLVIALRISDRRDTRLGHRPRRIGRLKYELREHRRDVRFGRTARNLGLPPPTRRRHDRPHQ